MKKYIKLGLIPVFVVFILVNCQVSSKISKDQERLMGIWSLPDDINATIEILEDSIYYVDSYDYFKYWTEDDSIFIQYEANNLYRGKYSIENDTLTITDKSQITKFYRFKE